VDTSDEVWLTSGVVTTLTKRGTISIPKPLRDGLALAAGDSLLIAAGLDGGLVLTKARRARRWLKVLRGCPEALPVPIREHFTERACGL